MMGHGHLGESLLRYDGEHGSVAAIADYLKEIDPLARRDRSRPPTRPGSPTIEARLGRLPAGAARIHAPGHARRRRRRRAGARAHPVERPHHRGDQRRGGAGSACSSLFLILHENRRQRQIAEMSRRSAEQAELASRAKSRFLTMMSHELRNPLNGVLGPLALLGQSDLAGRQQRLVDAGAAVGPVDAADAVGPARLRRDAGRPLPAEERARSGWRRSPRPCATRCAPRAPAPPRSPCCRARRSGCTATSTGCGRSSCTWRSTCSRAAIPATAELALRPRRREPHRRDRRRRRRRVDRLEARPADGPERDRARPGDRRGAAPADRPRPDLGLRRRADPGRGRRRPARRSASPFPPSRCASSRSACISRPARPRSPPSTRRRCAPTGWPSSRRRAPARSTSCWSTAPASARFR